MKIEIVRGMSPDTYYVSVDGSRKTEDTEFEAVRKVFSEKVENARKALVWKAGEVVSSVEVV